MRVPESRNRTVYGYLLPRGFAVRDEVLSHQSLADILLELLSAIHIVKAQAMIAGSPRSRLATVFKAPDQNAGAAPMSAFDAMRNVHSALDGEP